MMTLELRHIDRVLQASPILTLHLFRANENDWIALLSLSAEHAWVAERHLSIEGHPGESIREYLQDSDRLYPISRKHAPTPLEALKGLDLFLSQIPDTSINPWTVLVVSACGTLLQLQNEYEDDWPTNACTTLPLIELAGD